MCRVPLCWRIRIITCPWDCWPGAQEGVLRTRPAGFASIDILVDPRKSLYSKTSSGGVADTPVPSQIHSRPDAARHCPPIEKHHQTLDRLVLRSSLLRHRLLHHRLRHPRLWPPHLLDRRERGYFRLYTTYGRHVAIRQLVQTQPRLEMAIHGLLERVHHRHWVLPHGSRGE